MGWGVRTEEVMRLTWMSKGKDRMARAVVAVVLFSILMALWVWLWVPSVHVF